MNNRFLPYYNITAGGTTNIENSKFGEVMGALPVKIIPKFLLEFLNFTSSHRNKNESFINFLNRQGFIKMKEIITVIRKSHLMRQIKVITMYFLLKDPVLIPVSIFIVLIVLHILDRYLEEVLFYLEMALLTQKVEPIMIF